MPDREDWMEAEVGEEARAWLVVKASGRWHSLKHAPGSVAAEEVGVSCTKNKSGVLHKSVCQGLPLPSKGSGSRASLSVALVTFPVWLSFTLVIVFMV